ncbi:MAG TPA: hypothetical protein VM598_13825 [Bdellovibrionota bacterium]|nr:hypothetical protein [Bdellovibrionota bacterium]
MDRKYFVAAWIALGLGQLLLSSCSGTSTAAPAPREQAARTGESTPLDERVWLSRAMLERPLRAEVWVEGAHTRALESQVRWVEGEPIGEPPGPDAIADFRDRPGCAELVSSSGLALCLTVVPDLSSIEVSRTKAVLQGAQDWAARLPGHTCLGEAESFELVRAQVTDSELIAEFVGKLPEGSLECTGSNRLLMRVHSS